MKRPLHCAKQQESPSNNFAPATQNDIDDGSLSDMKRPVQCAEQQESSSNFTKYAPATKFEVQDFSGNIKTIRR